MGEFVKNMKNWRKMCKSFSRCVDCPMGRCINPPKQEWMEDEDEFFERLEDTVNIWAEEHPVPVYPTWGEYLMENVKSNYTDESTVSFALYAMKQRIRPDIADKLGVKPKMWEA